MFPSGSSPALAIASSESTGTWFCHSAAFRAGWNRAVSRALSVAGPDISAESTSDAVCNGAL